MSTAVNALFPVMLLIFSVPWCLRMARSTVGAPALNQVTGLASMTVLVSLGALVIRFGIVPAWTWYPSALAVGLGAVALCVRWPALVEPGPPQRPTATVVSLVLDAALAIMVVYACLR